MNMLPVLGAPLHWNPALLTLTILLVSPGAHLLFSPILERRRVRWRDDYAALLIGDPLLAVAAGLGALIAQPAAPDGWLTSWPYGLWCLIGGWSFGLWQSAYELRSGRYSRAQLFGPTKLWHQFVVYPVLGYWVPAAVWSGLVSARSPTEQLAVVVILGCAGTWVLLVLYAIKYPKLGHGTWALSRSHVL